MTERITLSLAALDEDIERRVMMATQLMAAHNLTVQVRPWDGTRSTLLIANADDTYGRNALEQVRRRGGQALAITDRPVTATGDVSPVVQVAELVERIKSFITPDAEPLPTPEPAVVDTPVALDPAQIGGLLQVCLQAGMDDDYVLAVTGPWQVLIRRGASRIAALSHSDLLAAQARMISGTWATHPLNRAEAATLNMEVIQSLDAFLISGCDTIADSLPLLPDNLYQLRDWPDLGTLTNHPIALRLASALVKQRWRVSTLATHCEISPGQCNAFCWAMLASGLLQSDLAIITPPAPVTSSTSPNILSRLARRFGLFKSE